MSFQETINNGKEKLFDLIYKGAAAFPYSNDLMHTGLIGSIPFLAGKYGSELLGTRIPFFQEHSTALGVATSTLAELAWQFVLEPRSPYDHPTDRLSDLKGVGETAIGTGLAYLLTKVI